MQIFKGVEQGSEEWHQMRSGVITGSKFSAVLAKGEGKTRRTYMTQLAAEAITGEIQEHFKSEHMERGNQIEPQARAMYEFRRNVDTETVSFVKHDDICAGVSPDGLVGSDGLVEFKCPIETTQLKVFASGKMPATYRAQVQGQMWICEREWCDFVSFNPDIEGEESWFRIRIERDEQYIKELEVKVRQFESDLNEMVKLLKG